MMAILVLARAYVRSRFTPTVFRSWRLAAGRLPCYFILCLLLLEATPQTRKVAMGYLLDGLPTAEEQDHRQTRKLVGTALGTTSPFPSFGTVSLPLRNGGSGETSYTPSVPDIKTFRKELKEMPAGKPTLWSREVEAEIYGVVGGLNNELHKRVERNAVGKGSETLGPTTTVATMQSSSYTPTTDVSSTPSVVNATIETTVSPTVHRSIGDIIQGAETILLARDVEGDKRSYLRYIQDRFEVLNFKVTVIIEEKDNSTSFYALRDTYKFHLYQYGSDFAYIYNDDKKQGKLSETDIDSMKTALVLVAPTLPSHPRHQTYKPQKIFRPCQILLLLLQQIYIYILRRLL
eukprot:GHVS01052393.1.p1 GENE.GHVS01052393.1~~GHVS01052393.1.p1  ORF type:complete len:347 (-),score=36.19 GHVS01052393.1:733-1773(-)